MDLVQRPHDLRRATSRARGPRGRGDSSRSRSAARMERQYRTHCRIWKGYASRGSHLQRPPHSGSSTAQITASLISRYVCPSGNEPGAFMSATGACEGLEHERAPGTDAATAAVRPPHSPPTKVMHVPGEGSAWQPPSRGTVAASRALSRSSGNRPCPPDCSAAFGDRYSQANAAGSCSQEARMRRAPGVVEEHKADCVPCPSADEGDPGAAGGSGVLGSADVSAGTESAQAPCALRAAAFDCVEDEACMAQLLSITLASLISPPNPEKNVPAIRTQRAESLVCHPDESSRAYPTPEHPIGPIRQIHGDAAGISSEPAAFQCSTSNEVLRHRSYAKDKHAQEHRISVNVGNAASTDAAIGPRSNVGATVEVTASVVRDRTDRRTIGELSAIAGLHLSQEHDSSQAPVRCALPEATPARETPSEDAKGSLTTFVRRQVRSERELSAQGAVHRCSSTCDESTRRTCALVNGDCKTSGTGSADISSGGVRIVSREACSTVDPIAKRLRRRRTMAPLAQGVRLVPSPRKRPAPQFGTRRLADTTQATERTSDDEASPSLEAPGSPKVRDMTPLHGDDSSREGGLAAVTHDAEALLGTHEECDEHAENLDPYRTDGKRAQASASAHQSQCSTQTGHAIRRSRRRRTMGVASDATSTSEPLLQPAARCAGTQPEAVHSVSMGTPRDLPTGCHESEGSRPRLQHCPQKVPCSGAGRGNLTPAGPPAKVACDAPTAASGAQDLRQHDRGQHLDMCRGHARAPRHRASHIPPKSARLSKSMLPEGIIAVISKKSLARLTSGGSSHESEGRTELLASLVKAIEDTERCAIQYDHQNLDERGVAKGKRVRFCSYDLSNVDMPQDTIDGSDKPARELVQRLLEVVNVQSRIGDTTEHGTRGGDGVSVGSTGCRAFLGELHALAAEPRSAGSLDHDTTDEGMVRCFERDDHDAALPAAARFILAEWPALRTQKVPGRSALRQKLSTMLASLIRFKLRILFNRPPEKLSRPGEDVQDKMTFAGECAGLSPPTHFSKVHELVDLKVEQPHAPVSKALLKLDGYPGTGALAIVAEAEQFVLKARINKLCKEETTEVARKHLMAVADVVDATRARHFLISLLRAEGVHEAIEAAGGWKDVEELAALLENLRDSAEIDSSLTLLSNMRGLMSQLESESLWPSRAGTVMGQLMDLLAPLADCPKKRWMTESAYTVLKEDVSDARQRALFLTVGEVKRQTKQRKPLKERRARVNEQGDSGKEPLRRAKCDRAAKQMSEENRRASIS